jgi:hypothetical protein
VLPDPPNPQSRRELFDCFWIPDRVLRTRPE